VGDDGIHLDQDFYGQPLNRNAPATEPGNLGKMFGLPQDRKNFHSYGIEGV
jgi:hypothetical protein